jgi:Chromate transporter
VIIPLMQNDAVNHYHWMTGGQFLNAVALGQITPGTVVQTVAVVGYAAAGLLGGVVAAVVAFSLSFAFVLLGRFSMARGQHPSAPSLALRSPSPAHEPSHGNTPSSLPPSATTCLLLVIRHTVRQEHGRPPGNARIDQLLDERSRVAAATFPCQLRRSRRPWCRSNRRLGRLRRD